MISAGFSKPHRGESRLQKLLPKTGRFEKNGGFTLLEVMIALALIAIVLITAYRLHSQTIDLAGRSKFFVTAPLLAQRKLAELATLDSLSSDSGNFSDAFPGYRWQVTSAEVESELLGASAKTLKRIDVRITFNETEYVYDLRAYRNFWD